MSGKSQSMKMQKTKSKVNNKRTRPSNRRRQNNVVVRRVNYTQGLTQSTRVKRKEILGTGLFEQGSGFSIKHFIFDAANGPAWFKKMCNLYEKYKVHSIDLEIVFGGSKMTKGTYILSYNTNYDQRNDNTASASAIMAQKGAKQVCAADQICRIHLNGSGLTGYSTTLPTTGVNSYCFDAIIAGEPVENLSFTMNVYYDITFYVPQISD